LILPIMLVVDRPWMLPPPSLTVWLALGALALLSTALAYVLYFRIPRCRRRRPFCCW
jgi:drug/metabolite transporter (DMT)-like permease